MQGSIQVRAAIENDAVRMAKFMCALSIEAPDTITHRCPPSAEDEIRLIKKSDQSDRSFILLAFEEEKIIGLLDFWSGNSQETRHSARFGVSVIKYRRNQGIGRKLIEAAIVRTLNWDGFCRLEVEVAPWNAPAVHLYERLGFQREGRKVKAINLRGEPEDLLMMARTW